MCQVFQVCGESSTKLNVPVFLRRFQDCQAARNDRGWTPLTAAVLGCLSSRYYSKEVSVRDAICWTPCYAYACEVLEQP